MHPSFAIDLVAKIAHDTLRVRYPEPSKVNIAESLVVAIREGMGTGVLPLYTAIDGAGATRYILQKMNIYAHYPSRKFIDAKTHT
jgi:hypothetical protein